MRKMEEDEKKRAERRSAMKSADPAMTGYDELEAREAPAISSNEPGVAWHVLCRARLLTSATVGDVCALSRHRHDCRRRRRLTARPSTKPTTSDNCLLVWGSARRSNPWPSRDATRRVISIRKKSIGSANLSLLRSLHNKDCNYCINMRRYVCTYEWYHFTPTINVIWNVIDTILDTLVLFDIFLHFCLITWN